MSEFLPRQETISNARDFALGVAYLANDRSTNVQNVADALLILDPSKSLDHGPRAETPSPVVMSDGTIRDIQAYAMEFGVGAPNGISLEDLSLPEGTPVVVGNGLPNLLLAGIHELRVRSPEHGDLLVPASSERIAGGD